MLPVLFPAVKLVQVIRSALDYCPFQDLGLRSTKTINESPYLYGKSTPYVNTIHLHASSVACTTHPQQYQAAHKPESHQ